MNTHPRPRQSLVAVTLIAASMFVVSPAAADPEPIPPSCEENEPCPPPPCDPQTMVNLQLDNYRQGLRIEHLEGRLEARRALVARLRARLHREWS